MLSRPSDNGHTPFGDIYLSQSPDMEHWGYHRFVLQAFIFHPTELYECVGDVPNVTFPCATLQDAETGRIAIYYGVADTVVALAFAQAEELIQYVKENAL